MQCAHSLSAPFASIAAAESADLDMLRAQVFKLVRCEQRPVRAAEERKHVGCLVRTHVLYAQAPAGVLQRLEGDLSSPASCQDFEQCLEFVAAKLERNGRVRCLQPGRSTRQARHAFFPAAAFLAAGLLLAGALFFGGLSFFSFIA